MKVIGVIPARYASVRFPGKPLAPLAGTPMVLHVLAAARAARRLDRVLVATDDARIADVVRRDGGEAVFTSPDAASGTDRLAETAAGVPGDVYVNVQGDEPLMPAENRNRRATMLTRPMRVATGRSRGARRRDPTSEVAVVRRTGRVYRARSVSRTGLRRPKQLGLSLRAETLRSSRRCPPHRPPPSTRVVDPSSSGGLEAVVGLGGEAKRTRSAWHPGDMARRI